MERSHMLLNTRLSCFGGWIKLFFLEGLHTVFNLSTVGIFQPDLCHDNIHTVAEDKIPKKMAFKLLFLHS